MVSPELRIDQIARCFRSAPFVVTLQKRLICPYISCRLCSSHLGQTFEWEDVFTCDTHMQGKQTLNKAGTVNMHIDSGSTNAVLPTFT